MSISFMVSVATLESGVTTLDQCKLCERQGVPIFPARQALVPAQSFDLSSTPEGPVETKRGWRTLRAGYLYVLLDRQHWQAYQVTADGYLRRFDPYVPPLANNHLLPDKCTAADHDCPSSFITIDIDKYKEAWLAFASDPWTESVLQEYKAQRGTDRFQVVDLSKLRDDPGNAGIAMTPDNLGLDKEVFEYQAFVPGRFNTAHAFYSRAARLRALSGYVKTSMKRYCMPNGIPVVAMEDAVGLVEEYNHQRNAWVYARQKWMADPDRAYQHQTSQILLAIRAMHRIWADEQIPKDAPLKWDQTPVHFDNSRTRPLLVETRSKDFDQRLEERYDEAQRAKFQKTYDKQFARYQEQTDLIGQGYAQALKDPTFIAAQEYDYDGEDFDSARAYVITMAQCLRGGISEAPVAPGEEDTGPVALQWKAWLENPQSPIYQALLMRDSGMLAALLPAFSAEGEAQWNDSVRIYDALTKMISSDEGGRLRRTLLREAIADLQGALNAASARLEPVLSPSIRHVVSRVNTATQLLYNGIHLVELKVSMKVGDFYALQSEHLRNLQRQAAEALENAPRRLIDGLDLEVQWAAEKARKVRPIILGGVLNLAALDPMITSMTMEVSVWVEGKASDLRDKLVIGANLSIEELGRGANATLQGLSVGVGTLEPQVRQMFEGLRITAQQAGGLVREGLTGLRGAAGSGPVLIAVGTLYLLSDVMKRNFEAVSEVIGDKSPEARMAFYGSAMGVTGGAVELVGLVMEKGAQQIIDANRLAARGMGNARDIALVGKVLVRLGATMVAAAGVFDAVQAGMAAVRTFQSGDDNARYAYLTSSVTFAAGGVVGIVAAASGATMLFGILGVAIILGMLGYGLFKLGESLESTPLEMWARRCFFGVHNEEPPIHWSQPEDALHAIAALNAVTLGIQAGLSFRSHALGLESHSASGTLGIPSSARQQSYIEYSLRLPHFDPSKSAYIWTLVLHCGHNGYSKNNPSQILLAKGQFGTLPRHSHASKGRFELEDTGPTCYLSDPVETPPPIVDITHEHLPGNKKIAIKKLDGSVIPTANNEATSFDHATLSIYYWPNQEIADGYSKWVTTIAKKI
jgi:hypothetical protein